MSWHRRMRNVSALVAAVVIPFGPIAMGAWDVHRTGGRAPGAPLPSLEDAGPAAEYWSRRNPLVDRLLPAGAGGIRFSERIGNAGETDLGSGVITLKASFLSHEWPESVELHERAHLVFTFLVREASALMRRLPAPAAGEYAAKDRAEHFAEMAAKAWEVVSPQVDFCSALSPADALREAEARVPGTAGFVIWYLRESSLGKGPGRAHLAAEAAALTSAQRHEWDALWRALESRRRPGPDRTFEPWHHTNVRASIEAQRAEYLAAGGVLATLHAALLMPSLAILSIAGS